MKHVIRTLISPLLIAIVGIALVSGCTSPSSNATTPSASVVPSVISTVPIDGTAGVPLNGTINVSFSEAMDPATIVAANLTLVSGTTSIAGAVSYNAATKTATFLPAAYLAASTVYAATITSGAKDLAGNALSANSVWRFTTSTTADTTSPTVASTVPADSASGVSINANIAATFSKGMDISTINDADFTLAIGATAVPGTVTYDFNNMAAIFAPTSNMVAGTTYTATITTGAKDLAGNALAANYVWTFATTLGVALGPAPVRLGTAGNFVILAKTAVTTVPFSSITGNVGLSPAAESYMTGFSQTKGTGYSTSPQVVGYLYAADQTPPTPAHMTTAISDMEAAYVDAATRPAPAGANTDIGGGTIGGMTFVPGLYKWGSTVNVTTDIYIKGAANDVWIFEVTKDLTLSSAVKVILQGGAQAKNIFWQVAGIASMGTTSHIEGIVLSQTQIIFSTGSSMNGRALAQTQVTMDKATLTQP